MIKFREQVPSIYSKASRDFQYLGWLIDIMLNSVKHNVDDLYDLPNTSADPRLAELLAMTLGFKVKRNYDQKQLTALVAALPTIFKYKGTLTAVDMAGKALIAASGATGSITSKVVDGVLEVALPKNLIDISLFTDLLAYILPAGMTSRIIRTDVAQKHLETTVKHTDILYAALVPVTTWDSTQELVTGVSSLFDAGVDRPAEFGNFIGHNTLNPNIGLLDNSIITDALTVNDPREQVASEIVNENSHGTTVTVGDSSVIETTNDNSNTVVIDWTK